MITDLIHGMPIIIEAVEILFRMSDFQGSKK
jgi:hypothetical protein